MDKPVPPPQASLPVSPPWPPAALPVPPPWPPAAPPIALPAPPLIRIPVAADSETCLIQPGLLTPPLVCVSTAQRTSGDLLESDLMLPADGLSFYRKTLEDKSKILVIHNAPFDLAVACNEDPNLVPLVFDALRDGRIVDTIVVQKLIDVALGQRKFRRPTEGYNLHTIVKATYGLADLINLYYGEHVDKEDTWRLSYGLLRGFPLSSWPLSAKTYAVMDAGYHLRLHEAQQKFIAAKWGVLPDQDPQQRAKWVLALMGGWGLRAEHEAAEKFIEHRKAEVAQMMVDLVDTGIFKPNGVRSMAEIRRRVEEDFARQGREVPRTDPSSRSSIGQVQTDKETLEATDDPALHVLASQMTFAKHLGQWGPVVRAAVHRPVCARYEELVETGRTACSGGQGQEGSNMQNPPRRGPVRAAFVPRQWNLFAMTDADTIELRAHAQDCLELVGWSKMAEALVDQYKNGGADLHLRLAAAIMGITPTEAMARKKAGDVEIMTARQFAKIPNFGYPGGLGAETMVAYAAGQLDKATHKKWFGVGREEQVSRATRLREVWFETWPENREYFKKINAMLPKGRGHEGVIRQLQSNRIRGGVRFTSCSNGFFQGRVADAMKSILFNFGYECYTGKCSTNHVHGGSNLCTYAGRSVLLGSRLELFLHDELIPEHPEDGSESDRAERQQQIMVEGLSKWMKDIPCTSSAVLCRRWYKGAEPLKIDGKLVPVKPVKIMDADGKERVKWVHDPRT